MQVQGKNIFHVGKVSLSKLFLAALVTSWSYASSSNVLNSLRWGQNQKTLSEQVQKDLDEKLRIEAARFAHQYIVTFKSNVEMNSVAQLFQALEKIRPLKNARVLNALESFDSLLVEDPLSEALAFFQEDQRVRWVYHNRSLEAPPAPEGLRIQAPLQAAAGNPGFVIPKALTWGVRSVKAAEAWQDTAMGLRSKILILDSGVDPEHPALKANIADAKDFLNDQPNAIYPYFDLVGHGSHTFGIAAGMPQQNGFSGVAPKSSVYVARVCMEACQTLAVVQALQWGITNKVQVANMSFSGLGIDEQEKFFLQKAYDKDIALVAASGNEAKSDLGYPAKLPFVISVGAYDQQLKIAAFSNWSKSLTISAPGVNIFSTIPVDSARESLLTLEQPDQSIKEPSLFVPQSNDFPEKIQGDLTFVTEDQLFQGANFASQEIPVVEIKNKAISEIVFKSYLSGARGVLFYFSKAPTKDQIDTLPLPIVTFLVSSKLGDRLKTLKLRNEVLKAQMFVRKSSYTTMDGTSMAAPHVTGAVALLKSLYPLMTPSELMQGLIKGAVPSTEKKLGSGLLDITQLLSVLKIP